MKTREWKELLGAVTGAVVAGLLRWWQKRSRRG